MTETACMSRDVEYLIARRGGHTGADFDPDIHEQVVEFIAECPVLCVGAGGLGCEILKDLALSGFKNIHVIDLDTIDVTNLNRQFLFRMSDVGLPKADVAAQRVMERVDGVKVTPYFARIEDKPDDFYRDFVIIILGLDSLEARRYMNNVVCSFLEFNPDGSVNPATVKPLIDGGTEGLRGHARVMLPGMGPCFECTLWLFPPQVKFPLCTLAETPRSPAHCIEFAHLIQWGRERTEDFDSDNEEHMQWVYQKALARAAQYSIPGVTLQLTQGVVKNIIPAIPSTNAIVAAACALEAFKVATSCLPAMDNYMMYMGGDQVYTHTVQYDRQESCAACGCGVEVEVSPSATLQQVLDALVAHPVVGPQVSEPGVSSQGAGVLYMHGPLEAKYRPNLSKGLAELLDTELSSESCVMLILNDKKLRDPLKVRLVFGGMQVDG